MGNKVFDFIDFQEVNKLLEGFNLSTGFVTAILDLDGNVLSQSGWRTICTAFHRQNPTTNQNCKVSDTVLANKMGLGEKYHFYECLNGLVDVAVPIVIKGEHVGNLFSGQFFFEEPDLKRFEKQAEKFGFDHKAYLEALKQVPVVSKDRVKSVLDFLLDMTQLISEITFQKMEQAELNKALQQSEDRFRKAFDINPDAITITRMSDGIYVSANNGFSQIFEYEPNEVIGKTSLGINMWHDPDDRKKFVDALLQNGLVENFEAILRTKSGKRIDALVSASTIDLNGVVHALSTTKDISKLKKIQKSLQSTQETVRKLNEELEKRVEMRTAQLEAANKELEAFSYSVSHDLRAPLRHISGYVDLLNNRYKEELPDKAQHYLSNISASSTQMGSLIDDLLQFSRTGRQEMHQMKFNMTSLFEDVFHKMKPDIKEREITWSIQQMPEVVGDYALLKQVWVNLLDNAVKYTRKEPVASIAVEWQDSDQEQIFLIRDNGVGFDMRYADKLFGVFQRLHAQTEFEGTGIGLANVKRIVQKHQGKVWAEAEPGKGATFYFSLPKNDRNI